MSAMAGTRALILTLAVIGAAGCSRSVAVAPDVTPPKIVLTALGAVGNPVFASDEAVKPKDTCAKFRFFPGRVVLGIDDFGGVARVMVRTLGGRILTDSVIVGPDAPESSWEITRPDGRSDVLTIQMRRPGASGVRTGVLAMFNVGSDRPPVALTASAFDYAGNAAHLYQVDLRASGDTATCR
jgi:hypothetical protein